MGKVLQKRFRTLIIISLFTPAIALSSFELIPMSSRQEAMGGTSGGCGAAGALWLNPASTVTVTRSWFSSTYTRLWGLPELSLSSLSYTHPFSFGSLSAAISNFGCSIYRENIGCFSFATQVKSVLDIGINLKWMHRSIGNELTENVASIDCGLIVIPIDEIMIEISSHNIGSPAIGVEPLHQDLLTGLIYQPGEELFIILNLLKQPSHPIQLCVGQELELAEWLVQRAGVKQNPTTMSLGFGIKYSSMEFDYAAVLHPSLGTTHSLSLNLTRSWRE